MSFRKRRSSATLQLDEASRIQANRKLSAASFEPLENMVVCPIDLNLLEDPRLLPCGHAFCCDCLTKYMHQLPMGVKEKTSTNEEPRFACPICRTVYPVPPAKSARTFPKAFNHLVILEFLRKNQMQTFKIPSAPPLSGENDNNNRYTMVANHRKSSTQVSSQMLNYIVNDITARERDGKISPADRAVIMDEISKLLQRLEGDQKSSTSPVTTKIKEPLQIPSVSNSSSHSPNGSVRGLGRFHAFADKVRLRRRSSVRPVQTEALSYTTYRDVESLRWSMKHKSTYEVLTKGKECCVMRAGENFQPVDMKLIPQSASAQVLRCTLTTDEDRRALVLWSQKIKLDHHSIPADSNRPKSAKESLQEEIRGAVRLNGAGPLKVQYVRFFKQHIYLTGLISTQSPSLSDRKAGSNLQTDSSCFSIPPEEYALLVCCEATSLKATENGTVNGTESSDPFPVRAVSCPFRRDSVGYERLDQPILSGIDIDRTNGDIYLAQPANAMICRLKAHDLSRIEGMWYLNEPQLSPCFLCYTNDTKEVWATCQREDKVVILDLETNGFHHFKPSVSFGINPSHIVYTSDQRIVMLDSEQSRLLWIAKIHHTICVQFLDVQLHSRQRRKFLAIQPVDDAAVMGGILDSPKIHHTLISGGILCAHDCGCSIIYPKKQLSKLRSVRLDCTSIFSC
ncbi:hypothetical protein CRM22_001110 [Opisthorchis felineus]|uniref:RING-type domain-containing protein n=2 Tax=Opisthorchis felineus TaxID=147828 RepID=A0A4S2MIJ9_OPIFE|nr:hypothetical protein CRM22_001110 [Opisthorchis felineus]